jgi:hypothetical protein
MLGAVRAKSLFAVLQSAAMGGYGAVAVNAAVRLFAGLLGAFRLWLGARK